MNIRIIRISDAQFIEATINPARNIILPSITDGWRFNFKKYSKYKGHKTFVLICEETPGTLEGCLIFRMKDEIEPYIAFVEIAPHNKGIERRYDKVAGCLIAYACRLSFLHGTSYYKGWLAFDVLEENKIDEIKLMNVYCKKYGALRWGATTTMVIS